MPRTCTVCTHAQRQEIDAALVAGEPNRRIAAQYGVTEQALRRHGAAHLPAHLAQAQQAAEVLDADKLLAELADLRAKTRELIEKAEEAGDFRGALQGIGQAVRCIEVAGKLYETGELQRRLEILEEGSGV